MTTEVYTDELLELARSARREQRLPEADISVHRVSRVCGSTITVDLNVDGERVTGYGHAIDACALGEATATIVAGKIEGRHFPELRALSQTMRRMLAGEAVKPEGDWSQLALLASVKDFPARHGSVLLVFDALDEAMDTLEARGK